jgi:hypothetical protein
MEPVFSLPYSEFCVAQQLAKLFPSGEGYSLFAPLSRQQPGVDLVLARRVCGRNHAACIQVKSSRTYSRRTSTSRTKRPFRYRTWFNRFECSPQADFYCLVTLYPAVVAAERRELGTWWSPQILLFTNAEMKRFMRSVKTVAGKPDKMFGFGFDSPQESFQTRGDSRRRHRSFSDHLLPQRLDLLREFLAR